MPVIVSFVVGFVLAQSAWWFAARSAMSASAIATESTFRFLILAAVEILVAAGAFGMALAIVSRFRPAAASVKSCFVAFAAGATCSTVAAGPYALIPRLVQGEGQLLIYIIAAAVISAAFGALVGAAFREATPG